jgi:hypothetical protein
LRVLGGPVVSVDLEEEGLEDEDSLEPKRAKKRSTTPFRVGVRSGSARGHGRGGRGGITLIQRLEMAASSLASDCNDDHPQCSVEHSPPVPPIPINFDQADEEEQSRFFSGDIPADLQQLQLEGFNDNEPNVSRLPSPTLLDPPTNRTSVDGMDPRLPTCSNGFLPTAYITVVVRCATRF